MDLIDDIDLVASFCRPVSYFFPDFPDIVHTVIRGRVDLDHVHRVPCRNRPAGRALSAGAAVHRVLTVHGLGKDFCHRGLSGPPGPAEQICMSDPPGGYLIFQGLDNGILAFHIFKLTGAKFPVQCHI